MIGVADVVGLLVIVGLNAAIAALATRFFRVRLATTWGSALYALVLTPIPLVATTLVLSGVLGLGPNLGNGATVVGLTLVLPMAIGIAFDYFWMPAPDEVEVPDTV
ncbi:MAG: hypothetical protein ABEJ31_01585 [Haloarculaceae archaeon]